MVEYIDKQAFNDAIREAVCKYPNTFYNGLEVARQIAHELPAANVVTWEELQKTWKIANHDVAPVRHGRWVEVEVDKDDDGIPTLIMAGCDQCHFVSWTSTPFCGYCGAKMDGGE